MNVYNSKPRRADDHRRTRRRDEDRARQTTTAELTTALPLFEVATGRIVELVSRLDDREPRMTDTEDRLRRTMETILDRIGDPEPRRHTMDRPGPARRVPRRAAQVKEAATAKRPRREMHSPPMPASKPPCVATARSWPTAPAGDGRTQCDSMGCSTRPGRVPPVGSGPLAARPGREGYPGHFWLTVEVLSTIFRRKPIERDRDMALFNLAPRPIDA